MDYRTNPPVGAPPGIRNNNPGNIKDDGTAWQGKAGNDGTFIIFADMSWGARAMGQSLINSWHGGNNTVRQIITAWAPALDNNPVDNYVNYVAGQMAVNPDDPLNLDAATLQGMVRAMANFEVGPNFVSYVTDDDITAGMGLISNNALSYLKAGAVLVQENPAESILVGIFVIGALYFIFRES